MKMIRNLEESTPFLLVLNQSVQEKTPANISLFIGDPESTLCVWAREGSSNLSQEKKCEDIALEATLALRKVVEESRCLVP